MYEFHIPVLLDETIDYLNIRPGKKYIDATIGGGGHAVEIVKRGGVLLGIDCDPKAVAASRQKIRELNQSPNRPTCLRRQVAQSLLVQRNFKDIDVIAREHGFDKVAGILFDLGMSSWQIEKSGRGFTFQKDEPLDMRADPTLRVAAADLVNGLTAKELYELFTKFGEEKLARRIADSIVKCRRIKRIEKTLELAGILAFTEKTKKYFNTEEFWQWYSDTFEKNSDKFGDFARRAKVFQALRIAVNDELNNLQEALPKAVSLLESEGPRPPSQNGACSGVAGGRLVVIAFHSLEDRIVKHRLKQIESRLKLIRVLTKKPVRPTAEEIEKNPRARSARLRAAEKIY